jgi:predicted nucleic acid-binding protein
VGSREVRAAVVDAGPLIHLTEIGGLALLHSFEALHIPDAVWSEAVQQGRVREVDMAGLSNIHRHTLPQACVVQFIQTQGLETLQAGDTECLYLCQQLSVSTLSPMTRLYERRPSGCP